jgi:cell division septum initiation protein DivIVA
MEIEQLKRENKFLKKKIEELNCKIKDITGSSKQSTHVKKKIKQRPSAESESKTNADYGISYFFEEVHKLMD